MVKPIVFLIALNLLGVLFLGKVNAQKITNVNIKFSSDWDISKIKVFLDNGKIRKIVKSNFINNHFRLVDTFFSKYAVVIVEAPYKGNVSHNNSFLISAKPATIYFNLNNAEKGNPLDYYKAINAIALYKTKGGKKLANILKKDYDEYTYVALKMNEPGNNSDSLQRILTVKSQIIFSKELEFVKRNGDKYFTLWFFKDRFVPAYFLLSPDSLLKIFNDAFSTKNKKSFEGKLIGDILHGRMLGRNNSDAPTFTAIDYLGNRFSLKEFSGKYVLLTFWASWCLPCIEELPIIKQVKKIYPDSVVQIVSVSYDLDIIAFKNAIAKYEMNWINIPRYDSIIKLYGDTPIPAMYLIDGNGKVVYSRFVNTLQDLFNKLPPLK